MRSTVLPFVVAALVVAGGCSGGGNGSGGSTAAEPSLVSVEGAGDGSESTSAADGSLPADHRSTSTAAPTTTVPPAPKGVPGLDDPSPFCASWARYSGTLQAIGVAAAFAELSSQETARMEVTAAAALVDAVGGIGSSWPAELVGERSVVLTDVVGPFGRRAEKAHAALVEAGASPADLEELAQVWLAALRDRDPDDPELRVAVPARLEPLVDAAAAAFDAAVTPFTQDPSLASAATDTPSTDAYLAATCPELATSGVGDAL